MPPSVHAAQAPPSPGYWLFAPDGGVYQFGAAFDGSMRGHPLFRPIVGMASTASGAGYWMVASDGGIFSFGDAAFDGSMGGHPLNRPVVGMAATPDGGGYWLVASDGGIFSFGDARFFGSTGSIRLNQPIVGMAAPPDGGGYWLVASDGGIFSFGDAAFYGSMGGHRLNAPVLGMAAVPSGGGYWLVAADGGIFSFGSAPFLGSTGGIHLNRPVVGMAANPLGPGYWLVASDGGIFTFGGAPFLGSTGGQRIPLPIIGMAATRLGVAFPPGATGFDISWPQCGGPLPPPAAVAVVGINGGTSHNAAGNNINPNPCLAAEGAWAGQAMAAYINVDGVPAGAMRPAAANGPAGACAAGDFNCQGFNWGWDGAVRAVLYAHSLGLFPSLWFLDVEGPCGFRSPPLWRCASDPGGLASNAAVIQGALAALAAEGVIGGVYSTYLQFPATAGGYSPGTPIWIAGASSVGSAAAFCVDPTKLFAGGRPMLVQYGYPPAPPPQFDPDFACA